MLKIGTQVSGGYQVSSMPFESEKEAKAWIEEYWRGTTFIVKAIYSTKDGKWYIVSK